VNDRLRDTAEATVDINTRIKWNTLAGNLRIWEAGIPATSRRLSVRPPFALLIALTIAPPNAPGARSDARPPCAKKWKRRAPGSARSLIYRPHFTPRPRNCIEMCKVAASTSKYISHMRSEGTVVRSVDELLRIAREAKFRRGLSHQGRGQKNGPKLDEFLAAN